MDDDLLDMNFLGIKRIISLDKDEYRVTAEIPTFLNEYISKIEKNEASIDDIYRAYNHPIAVTNPKPVEEEMDINIIKDDTIYELVSDLTKSIDVWMSGNSGDSFYKVIDKMKILEINDPLQFSRLLQNLRYFDSKKYEQLVESLQREDNANSFYSRSSSSSTLRSQNSISWLANANVNVKPNANIRLKPKRNSP